MRIQDHHVASRLPNATAYLLSTHGHYRTRKVDSDSNH